ncbi:hypothetical protein B7494_g5733 [Chlorociboria aeruginascens]|nr:hypothetical protein B7494_g5733 [Chlorociboria aeruginascens]
MSLPPVQPAYILRGHSAQIHNTTFIRANTRLVTADAEGWVVIWDLSIKRPVAVWKAHEGSILGSCEWGCDKIITHGKDNKLIVWKLTAQDESSMSIVLPVDTPPTPRPQPWLLYILEVNTMNFCSFSQCTPLPPSSTSPINENELLIAVPNTVNSETASIFHLPSLSRIHTIPANPKLKTGIIMALTLFHHPTTLALSLLTGYESGHTTVSTLNPSTSNWQILYISQPHSQPILSLCLSPAHDSYLTSSADSLIAQHPIQSTSSSLPPTTNPTIQSTPLKILNTKHAGQQSLRLRSDGKIFATAGWDGKIRVYGMQKMREVAVLKWHKEGVYAVAFADVLEEKGGYGGGHSKDDENTEDEKQIANTEIGVKEERLWKARNAHWLVAGGKDGKVSLWDIY